MFEASVFKHGQHVYNEKQNVRTVLESSGIIMLSGYNIDADDDTDDVIQNNCLFEGQLANTQGFVNTPIATPECPVFYESDGSKKKNDKWNNVRNELEIKENDAMDVQPNNATLKDNNLFDFESVNRRYLVIQNPYDTASICGCLFVGQHEESKEYAANINDVTWTNVQDKARESRYQAIMSSLLENANKFQLVNLARCNLLIIDLKKFHVFTDRDHSLSSFHVWAMNGK
jgi:hypothetical protein